MKTNMNAIVVKYQSMTPEQRKTERKRMQAMQALACRELSAIARAEKQEARNR